MRGLLLRSVVWTVIEGKGKCEWLRKRLQAGGIDSGIWNDSTTMCGRSCRHGNREQ